MLQGRSSCSLNINALGAGSLKKVQRVGKQDPYLQFSLDFEDKEKFCKTYTHQNAGETASWNQSFTITISGEPDLFIEVLDEENTSDEVIGFAAIPINQIVHADGAHLNGIFEIYDTKKERAGEVHLQLAAIGFPNSRNPNWQGSQPVRGQSYIHEGHLKRMTSNHRKQQGIAVGGALLGGALAIGAGFLAKRQYDRHEAQEAEEERLQQEEQQRREEEDRRRREEQENYNRERQEFDSERQRFEREKSEYEQSHQYGGGNESHYERHEHHEHHEHRHHSSGGRDAERWNPVGTYAAGERVEYHGQVYMCLQGHTSNPTWQPGAAHSLWQAE